MSGVTVQDHLEYAEGYAVQAEAHAPESMDRADRRGHEAAQCHAFVALADGIQIDTPSEEAFGGFEW